MSGVAPNPPHGKVSCMLISGNPFDPQGWQSAHPQPPGSSAQIQTDRGLRSAAQSNCSPRIFRMYFIPSGLGGQHQPDGIHCGVRFNDISVGTECREVSSGGGKGLDLFI